MQRRNDFPFSDFGHVSPARLDDDVMPNEVEPVLSGHGGIHLFCCRLRGDAWMINLGGNKQRWTDEGGSEQISRWTGVKMEGSNLM